MAAYFNRFKVAEGAAYAVYKKLEELGDVNSDRNLQPTIWKISSDIRKGFDGAYEPNLMPIGPFHRKKEDVASMAKLKLLYVHDFLARNKHNGVIDYAQAIANCEEDVRRQYSEDIDLTSEEFVMLLVIDGCFVLEFLRKHEKGMPLAANKRNMPMLRHDLLLMENQIPWFVLDTIYKKFGDRHPHSGENPSLLDLAYCFLHGESMLNYNRYSSAEDNEIFHLLHLSYLCLLQNLRRKEETRICFPSQTLEANNEDVGLFRWLKVILKMFLFWVPIAFLYVIVSLPKLPMLWKMPGWWLGNAREKVEIPGCIPTATELWDVGVQFKKKENARCFLDVSYHDGTLEIGQITINDYSKSVFLNLQTFEQSSMHSEQSSMHSEQSRSLRYMVTSYLVFMGSLVNTVDDVVLLKHNGVIESKLGSDQDVVNIFNSSGPAVISNAIGLAFISECDGERHFLEGIFDHLNGYYKKHHNTLHAKLIQMYNVWPKKLMQVRSLSLGKKLGIATFLIAYFTLLVTYFQPFIHRQFS